jgi:hypothetical protein
MDFFCPGLTGSVMASKNASGPEPPFLDNFSTAPALRSSPQQFITRFSAPVAGLAGRAGIQFLDFIGLCMRY